MKRMAKLALDCAGAVAFAVVGNAVFIALVWLLA